MAVASCIRKTIADHSVFYNTNLLKLFFRGSLGDRHVEIYPEFGFPVLRYDARL
jgi:hypothetical protein